MNRTRVLGLTVLLVISLVGLAAANKKKKKGGEDDPFAGGGDQLAVKDGDGSSSVRAKLKLTKMAADMLLGSITALDDKKYPACVFTVKVLKAPSSQDKFLKLIAAGKSYRFAPVLKMKGKAVDLKDEATQSNLGACYYPAGTKVVVKVTGVDLKAKHFAAGALYLK